MCIFFDVYELFRRLNMNDDMRRYAQPQQSEEALLLESAPQHPALGMGNVGKG